MLHNSLVNSLLNLRFAQNGPKVDKNRYNSIFAIREKINEPCDMGNPKEHDNNFQPETINLPSLNKESLWSYYKLHSQISFCNKVIKA